MFLSALKKPNIVKLLFGSVLYDAVLIVTFANVLIKQIGKTATIITIALVTKKVIRTIFDVPSGVIVDKYLTPRKSVLLSIVLKIAFISLLWFDNLYTLILSSVLEGFSLSFFRGKSGVLQYEIFEKEGMNSHFELFSSAYGLIVNLSTTAVGLIAGMAYRYGGMDQIFVGSVAGLLLAGVSIYLLPDRHVVTRELRQNQIQANSHEGNKDRHHKSTIPRTKATMAKISKLPRMATDSVAVFFGQLKQSMLLGPHLLSLSIISGLASLGWQINAINQFLAMHTMKNPASSANVFQMGTAIMSAGCIITMTTKSLRPKTLSLIIYITLLIGTIVSGITPQRYAFLAVIPYLLASNTAETGARKAILESLEPSKRSSVIGVSTTITSVLSTLTMCIFQLAGEKFGYQKAYFCIFLAVWLMSALPLWMIAKMDQVAKTK